MRESGPARPPVRPRSARLVIEHWEDLWDLTEPAKS